MEHTGPVQSPLVARTGRPAALVAVVWLLGSFSLNAAWEVAQWPLYTHFAGFTGRHLSGCLYAAAGDVVLLLLLYVLIAVLDRDSLWVLSARFGQFAMLAALGATSATFLELRALSSDRWGYRAAMPLVPGTGVGLVPILQMEILPVVLAYVSRWLARRAAASEPGDPESKRIADHRDRAEAHRRGGEHG